MASDTGRPSQPTQRSRKGKKAWRKNINLDDFEQGLDDQRDAEIVLGPEQELFTIDKSASDEGLTTAMKSEKKLKSQEILNARSAVPPVLAHHRKKDKPKHKVLKDRKQLLERAGFTDKSKTQAEIERDGILKSGGSVDLWADAPESEPPTAAAIKRWTPDAPIPGTPAIDLPSGGQSYNPALEDWKATILAEHSKLEKDEAKQIQAEEEQARIEAIIAETEARLAEPSHESDSDSEDVEPGELGRLSVNPPSKLKRKTKAERNRLLRHKQWLNDIAQLKQKKQFVQELARKAQIANEQRQAKPQPKQSRRLLRAHSAHPVAPEPLAVKLSDELDDSMRRIKPEGSLIKERLRSLQARGVIEARVPVRKPKSRAKMVEKWSYKHFK